MNMNHPPTLTHSGGVKRRMRRRPPGLPDDGRSIKSALKLLAAVVLQLRLVGVASFSPPSRASCWRAQSQSRRRWGTLTRRRILDGAKSSTTSPRLSMVAKTGGRLILSTEQFEREVLRGQFPSADADSGGDADAGADTETATTPLPVLVLFTAPWCGPCRLTTPVVKEIMKQYASRLRVVEISTDDLPEVASDAGVVSIPTILIYHGGVVKDTIVGCVAKNVLARSVEKVLEDLGMGE